MKGVMSKMTAARLIMYPNKRQHPLKSGYRPLFLINESYYSGIILFEGNDITHNEIRNVEIDFLTFKGHLNQGDIIKFYESPNNGIGEIHV